MSVYEEIEIDDLVDEDINLTSLEETGLPIVLDTREAQAFLCELVGMKKLSDKIRCSILEDMYK